MSHVPQARYVLESLSPVWLRRPYGRSFCTEGLATIYDIDNGIMRDGLLARFPSCAPDDALPLICRDRLIERGPHEAAEAIRARLLQWIDIHELSGLPFGLLLAVQGFFAPWYPQVRLVSRRGLWHTLAEGTVGRMLRLAGYAPLAPASYELGAQWPKQTPPMPEYERARDAGLFTRYMAPAPNWDWDSLSNPGHANRWWHAWLMIYPPRYPLVGNYDSNVFYDEPTQTWGFDEPEGTFTTLRTIIRRHKPARTRMVSVIFPPTLADFPPTALANDPGMPDGYWGEELKLVMGEWVTSRRLDCRYLFFEENE